MTGAITFDFHNTLVHCDRWFALETEDLVAAFLQWRAEQEQIPPATDQMLAARDAYRHLRRQIVDHGEELPAERCVAAVLDQLGIAVPADQIDRGVQRLMADCATEAQPLPGAIDTVHGLAAANIPLGIVSSAVYHPFLEWTLARFKIDNCFGAVTTSASSGYYKSRPEIFALTLGMLNALPKCSVHVGDSYRFDVETASHAGMSTVWVQGLGAGSDSHASVADLALTDLVDATTPILDLWTARNAGRAGASGSPDG